MSVPGPPRPTPDWQHLACRSCRWLVVAVVLLAVATGVGAASEPVNVDTGDLNGSGTTADPYEISNASELQAIEDDLDEPYELVDDINATGTENWNSGNGFDPVGSFGSAFKGTFDGNDHVISDLYIDRSSEDETGLFGYVDGGKVENVDLDGGNVTGNKFVGALVGSIWDGSVTASNASTDVDGTGQEVGGLVGELFRSTITDSSASGDVEATAGTVGGLVGSAYDGGATIENSFATGDVDGNSYAAVGGLVGYGDADIKQSYATGSVDGGGDIGGLVGHTYGGVITDSNATGAVTGSGNDVGGLVGWVDASDVEVDASKASGSVTGTNQVGGLVGTNRGTVRRSTATGSVTGSNDVGGLVGYGDDDSLVNASSATGAVTGTNRVGGLVGDGYLVTVTASNATGTVDGDEKVGGLVGRSSESTITDSNASGDVAATANDVGGLVGNVTDGKRIENSSATGEVNGSGNVGGLVGYNLNTNITRSYATGHVDGASKVGGLVGWNDGSNRQAITESYATGTVNGTNSIGGLVGWNFGRNLHVQRSFATGTVTATTGGAGGLIGTNRGPVANTSANGTVIGDTAAGGLVGRNTGTISDSLATGTVNNTAASTGGLVAFNNSGVGTAVDAYWDINATNQSTSEGGTGVTTANLTGQSVSTVAGLNDTSVWTPTDSYPVLRWRVEDIGLTLADTDLDVGDSTAATTTLSLAGGGPTTATTTSDYSSDSSVATVDSGTVTTSGLGTATITAEHAGLDASIQLSVIQPPSSGGSSSSICTTGVDITTTDDGTESTADIEQSDTNGTTAVSRDGGQPLAVTANTSIESLSLVTDTHCEFSVTVRADETADRTAANASFESPDAVSTTPVGYLTIQDDLAADELTDATITFSVDTATAADGTITLYRGVGDEWRPMNTTIVNETSAMTQYEADTAEFSTFAIGLNQPQTTDPVDETDDAGTVDELDTGIAGLLLIGLLLIVGLLSVGWWRRDDADRTGETDSE